MYDDHRMESSRVCQEEEIIIIINKHGCVDYLRTYVMAINLTDQPEWY